MVIGITGGVGCGKSTIIAIMKERYDFTVMEADKIGHLLMKKGEKVYDTIVRCFGKDILDEDGNIDRSCLGAIVFNDSYKLDKLNSIIHPGVRNYIEDCIKNAKPGENFLIEAALLLEAGYRDVCDQIWYIYASEDVRRRRLKESRGYSDEKITQIMKNQLDSKEFMRLTDYTIDNNDDVDKTLEQIEKILEF